MAMLGNHTPRQCGIATFTADLRAALVSRCPHLDCFVFAMNDPMKHYAYPPWVRGEIAQEASADYPRAAQRLNGLGVDVLSLQHEYGIFGGSAGSHILGLLRELRMPVVTTLHTILPEPDPRQWTTLDEILRRSERVVVMSAHGAELLRQIHGVPAGKIDLIPHGIPPVFCHGRPKSLVGVEGRQVLLTFGLLAPDKGIEYVIDAMPGVLERFPGTVYVVLGATHPHIKASQGERYRAMLEERARSLGVADSVIFHNRFVDEEELTRHLAAADIYITPYLKLEQITSGTLAYALGSGKAVISTPYLYARELLAEGRGILVPCRDPAAITREVLGLLGDDAGRLALRRRAAAYGRTMAWPVVAGSYLESFSRARRDFAARQAPRGAQAAAHAPLERHLERYLEQPLEQP
jgi:glycosyltransferase involved in cell wall biosynthesis